MRTRKTLVVLISGKAGSGKSTAAKILNDKMEKLGLDTLRYGFADPIKHIAKAFGGWDEKKDDKGRQLLQKIGYIFREYDEHIWVKHFLNQLDKRSGMFPKNVVIIDDWRFPNELAYLQNNPILETVTVRMYGRGGLEGENSFDISENSLPEGEFEDLGYEMVQGASYVHDPYTFSIKNDGDLDILEHKLELVLAEIKKQYIVE